ncbi:glycosyltransferase, partial [Candidatus Woesearchaeota archaeon]|nr:glycosyltransferase [Candidatus Woesearchaeota archaeon]
MKILELCHFSAGICGVWSRVKEEAKILAKSHEVKIFSSNAVKGSKEIAPYRDKLDEIDIIRFPFRKFGGESFMAWDFEKEALDFKPNLIITHSYRHLHTTKALKIAKKINAKVFLVTHAPFVEDNNHQRVLRVLQPTRSILASIAVKLYDSLIGPRTINRFDKVIAITHWEMPYLEKLGCKKDSIAYIPNSVPEKFFKTKIKKFNADTRILFLGRISPIK